MSEVDERLKDEAEISARLIKQVKEQAKEIRELIETQEALHIQLKSAMDLGLKSRQIKETKLILCFGLFKLIKFNADRVKYLDDDDD